MRRYHFEDLTAINCPFGLLDDDTQDRLKSWPHGREWFTSKGVWIDIVWSSWARGTTYRAKPEPLTKPHVPDDVWRALPDWVVGVAQDSDGMVRALSDGADTGGAIWRGIKGMRIDWLKGVTPGTCDWRDSWVPRPEGL